MKSAEDDLARYDQNAAHVEKVGCEAVRSLADQLRHEQFNVVHHQKRYKSEKVRRAVSFKLRPQYAPSVFKLLHGLSPLLGIITRKNHYTSKMLVYQALFEPARSGGEEEARDVNTIE